MSTALATCPSCAARLPSGADWCSLCFADLRPPPPVVVGRPAPAVAPPSGPGTAAPPSGAYLDLALPFDDDPGAAPQGERTVEAMLARLAAEESHDPLSSLGAAGTLLRGGRSKAVVIVVAALLLTGLALAAMAVLGALTT